MLDVVQGSGGLVMALAVELGLFAAVIFLLFGLDDLAVDAMRLSGIGRPADERINPAQPVSRRFAVFVPAWQEGATLAAMLSTLSARWAGHDIRIYVGVYPNDLATMMATVGVARRDKRVRICINQRPGPTTKGDCLNRLWRACEADMRSGRFAASAVVLHDAEDVVDAGELVVFDRALAGADFVQIPVIPVADPRTRWIGGHYCDEFAEAHQKDVPVRAALGAPLPLAGVGCAISMTALRQLGGRDGPFHADSLTEDYELGIRLSAAGFRGVFSAMRTTHDTLVATRGCFPDQLTPAVRQKTRWMQGIALNGWVRLGWPVAAHAPLSARLTGYWMLWRDRRVVIAALAVLCGYAALALMILATSLHPDGLAQVLSTHPVFPLLAGLNLVLLGWRAMVRMVCVQRNYGWTEAGLALLRMPLANVLLIMTARRAVARHWRQLRGGPLLWEKTAHRFPELGAAGGAVTPRHGAIRL